MALESAAWHVKSWQLDRGGSGWKAKYIKKYFLTLFYYMECSWCLFHLCYIGFLWSSWIAIFWILMHLIILYPLNFLRTKLMIFFLLWGRPHFPRHFFAFFSQLRVTLLASTTVCHSQNCPAEAIKSKDISENLKKYKKKYEKITDAGVCRDGCRSSRQLVDWRQLWASSAFLPLHCTAESHSLSFLAFFIYGNMRQGIYDIKKWFCSISNANKLVLVSIHVFQLYIICWRWTYVVDR